MTIKIEANKTNRADKSVFRSSASLSKVGVQPDLLSPVEAKQIFRKIRVDPRTLRAHDLLRLQRAVGNHDVNQLLASRSIQAKLKVNATHDRYEEEADRVAEQVMHLPATIDEIESEPHSIRGVTYDNEEIPTKPVVTGITHLLRRSAPKEIKNIETGSIPPDSLGVDDDLDNRLRASRRGGTPLSDSAREFMELRFGADFSDVRMHTDAQADQLNRSLRARAFTSDRDIFFRRDEYNPSSRDGKQLLAHELTHVVQQSRSAAQTPSAGIVQRYSITVGKEEISIGDKSDFKKNIKQLRFKLVKDKKKAELKNLLDALQSRVRELKHGDIEYEGERADIEGEIKNITEALITLGEETKESKTEAVDTSIKRVGALPFEEAYTLLTNRPASSNKKLNTDVKSAIETMDKVRIGARDWTTILSEELESLLKITHSKELSEARKHEKKAMRTEGFTMESTAPKKSSHTRESSQTMQELLESLGMGNRTANGAHGLVYDDVRVTLKNHETKLDKNPSVHLTFYPKSETAAVTRANWSQLFDEMHVTIEFYGADDIRNPRCYWNGSTAKWDAWNWGAKPRPGNSEQRAQAEELIKSSIQDPIIKDIEDRV